MSEDRIQIDKDGALARLGGDTDLYQRVCQVFVKHAPLQMKNLKEAIESRTFSEIGRLSHSLKSEAANIGAEKMRAMAFDIEMAAKDENIDTVVLKIEPLAKCLDEVLEVLK